MCRTRSSGDPFALKPPNGNTWRMRGRDEEKSTTAAQTSGKPSVGTSTSLSPAESRTRRSRARRPLGGPQLRFRRSMGFHEAPHPTGFRHHPEGAAERAGCEDVLLEAQAVKVECGRYVLLPSSLRSRSLKILRKTGAACFISFLHIDGSRNR